jgi:hypothetical protein
MQVGVNTFWKPSVLADTMRINFEPEDVDRKAEGDGFANMHHIIQYSGGKGKNKNYIANWAMLIIHPNTLPGYTQDGLDNMEIQENTLLSCAPNPLKLNSNSAISFSLTKPSFVILEVLSMDGRIVNTIVNTNLGSGKYSYSWNGKDYSNRPLPRGLYILTLKYGLKR